MAEYLADLVNPELHNEALDGRLVLRAPSAGQALKHLLKWLGHEDEEVRGQAAEARGRR